MNARKTWIANQCASDCALQGKMMTQGEVNRQLFMLAFSIVFVAAPLLSVFGDGTPLSGLHMVMIGFGLVMAVCLIVRHMANTWAMQLAHQRVTINPAAVSVGATPEDEELLAGIARAEEQLRQQGRL